jgi:hypothetical protein
VLVLVLVFGYAAVKRFTRHERGVRAAEERINA